MLLMTSEATFDNHIITYGENVRALFAVGSFVIILR